MSVIMHHNTPLQGAVLFVRPVSLDAEQLFQILVPRLLLGLGAGSSALLKCLGDEVVFSLF